MLIARVVGTVVSTIKDDKLIGRKILIVRETTAENELVGKPIAAIDTGGRGHWRPRSHRSRFERVRQTQATKETPTDAVIMAIIDELAVDGKITFKK